MNQQKIYRILNLIVEEASEVIKEVCKINDHGLDSYNPVTGETNVDLVRQELSDLLCVIDFLFKEGFLTDEIVEEGKAKKLPKLRKWRPYLFED